MRRYLFIILTLDGTYPEFYFISMGYHRFIARLSGWSLQCMAKTYHFMNAVMTGFWLGVMSDKSLDQADDLHYKCSKKYINDTYNKSGLSRWEKAAIEKYFKEVKSILLIAAGGGRETYALSNLGFEVDSYECNKELVEYGNQFLERNGIASRIEYLPRDTVPREVRVYDGIIVGWGAYTHIRGREERISFLESLKPYLKKGAPLMLSFLLAEERTRQDIIVRKVANFFRFFSRKRKLGTGDWLQAGFVHYFTGEEIKAELADAGYKLIGFNSVDYGSLVASI